jgi:ribonuclease Y
MLVQFARKDASAERDAARRESDSLREEARDMMSEAQRREERVAQRERELTSDQRNAQMYSRGLEERVAVIARDEKRLVAERDRLSAEHQEALASIAGTSVEDAKAQLIAQLTEVARSDAAGELRRIEKTAKHDAEVRARRILVDAMQRQAAETTAQNSVTWFDLPSEEMKGRIIGREGRNIRAFEALTGVNIIVDEGVTGVQLSCFDVERREIALVTLQSLVDDGRIQPQRVEAEYAKALLSAPERHLNAGLDAVEAAKVGGVPQPLVAVLGRLRLRTSYGQNVLAHLVEASQLAADLAAMVGADIELARRGALLHDLGKAFTHERDGSHASIGAELAAEHGESAAVVNAIAAHHDEVPQETLEAVIVQIADAVSASRPGARRDDVEAYVERMENLEKIVGDHPGVAQVLAMAAGREVRVVVEPDEVDDAATVALARTIAERINSEFSFPGEIKVTVIRELRADAVAGEA